LKKKILKMQKKPLSVNITHGGFLNRSWNFTDMQGKEAKSMLNRHLFSPKALFLRRFLL